jgi:hypothetical protein
MKKYFFSYPFEGSLTCEVIAETEGEAMLMAEMAFDSMSNDTIAEAAQFGHIEIIEN